MIGLKDILYKIKIDNQPEYINDLLKTAQVQSVIFSILERYKENKNEVKYIIEYNIKLLLLKTYKYQKDFTEEKFISYLRKTLPTRVYRMFNEKFMEEINYSNINDFESIDNWDKIDNDIALKEAINKLEPIQKKIIFEYYFYGRTEIEIATEMNVTRQYIHEIKMKAIINLKKILK